jgi:hypothetical protein
MGGASQQDYLRRVLGLETHATSSHALREWRHIVEGAAVDILNTIRARPSTLANVFASLSQGWGRSQGHRLRVLSLVTGGETSLDLELMEIRARQLLRFKANDLFHNQIDVVRDGSQCGLARNTVVLKPDGKLAFINASTGSDRCKKTDTICRQDADLESKKSELTTAGTALSSSADHRKVGKAALDAARDPDLRKGKVCYALLGDVSIALECAAGETILTTDRSFEVMAPPLQLAVDRFEATSPP